MPGGDDGPLSLPPPREPPPSATVITFIPLPPDTAPPDPDPEPDDDPPPRRRRRRWSPGLVAFLLTFAVGAPLIAVGVYQLVQKNRTRPTEKVGGSAGVVAGPAARPPADPAAADPGELVTVTGTAVRFSEDSITEGAAARLYLTVRTAPGVDVVCVFPPGSAKDERYDGFAAGERVVVRGRLDSPPTAHAVGTLADCVLVSRRR